jgi:type VI secretion system secreted protein Hcp
MAVDMFLKIDDIKGESSDSKHKDEIEVLAWSWGMSQSGSTHSGSGSGSGKVSVQDISITKPVDRASPNLMKMCCTGQHFKTAMLVVRKAGGKSPVEYIKLELKEGIVSSVQTGGSGGEDRLTENVTLNFGAFKYEYTPQKADGSGDAAIPAQFDIAKNTDK